MKALVQRVTSGSVVVDEKIVGEIEKGMVIFLGVGKGDTESEINVLIDKIINLRIFPKDDKEFDVSLKDIGGSALVVSQFTLCANCKKGRRPSFDEAASPEEAKKLYEVFVERFKQTGIPVETGEFQAYMAVNIQNDGPVTFMIET